MGEVQTPKELAQEMINKLPEEIFISDKTTFLDPCIGSGTFLKEIALKLRKYDHSKENINLRLMGIEKSIRFINKIQQLQGFNPTLVHADFLEYDFNWDLYEWKTLIVSDIQLFSSFNVLPPSELPYILYIVSFFLE